MTDTKFYKNPLRQQAMAKDAQYKPYVPNYQQRGIAPESFMPLLEKKQFNTNHQALLIKATPDITNSAQVWRGQDAKPINHNVPFAEILASEELIDLPNVGNNVENTWASIDGGIVDDMGLLEWDGTQEMIDNNDYVEMPKSSPTITIPMAPEAVEPSLQTPLQDQDEYLVAVEDTIIATGSLEQIEQEVEKLLFGEHALCEGRQIPLEDIIVLKRLHIKVGVSIG